MIGTIIICALSAYIILLITTGIICTYGNSKDSKELDKIKVGDKFVGKLQNEYRGQVIYITKNMLTESDALEGFLHYNGFEKQ